MKNRKEKAKKKRRKWIREGTSEGNIEEKEGEE